MLRDLLTMRLLLANAAGGALAGWAHSQGFITPIFTQDASFLSYAIAGLFTLGLASTFIRAGKVTAAINAAKAGTSDVWLQRKAAKMDSKNAHLASIAAWLQILGLLGTCIGLKIAIGGLEGDNTSVILSGFSTAIGTTILGGFLSLWTYINSQMLDTATSALVEDVSER